MKKTAYNLQAQVNIRLTTADRARLEMSAQSEEKKLTQWCREKLLASALTPKRRSA